MSSFPQLDGDGGDGSSMLQDQCRDWRGEGKERRFVNKTIIKGKCGFRETETICQISKQSRPKERRKLVQKNPSDFALERAFPLLI